MEARVAKRYGFVWKFVVVLDRYEKDAIDACRIPPNSATVDNMLECGTFGRRRLGAPLPNHSIHRYQREAMSAKRV